MSESNTTNAAAPDSVERRALAGLMSLAGASAVQVAEGPRAAWSEAELAAIWRHQLNAPLLVDLGGVNEDANATVTLHTRQAGPALQSFADLLAHPSPPVELLQLAKEFAKTQRYAEEAAFPVEIASVLYYMAILLALLRAGQRITEMDDARIRQGMQWCLQQPWIDPATRALFEEESRKLAMP